MAKREWWQRPRLRTDEELQLERRVTWLELFFDLVFVVAIAEVAHGLSANISLAGAGEYLFLFLPLWWVWIGATYYIERFETEGVDNRLFLFGEMVTVAGLGVFAQDALGKTSVPFALSYAAARTIVTVMWWRAGRHEPAFRPTANRFTLGFCISIALFLLSTLVAPSLRFVLWAIALVVDVMTPAFTLSTQAKLPRFSSSKLPERYGLFVIIVLGETVVGVVQGLAAREELLPMTALIGVLGMALSFGLWWVYFDYVARRPPKHGTAWAFVWGYSHMPLVICIAAVGAGLLEAIAHDDPVLPFPVRALIGCALGAALAIVGGLEKTLYRAADEPTHPWISPGLKWGAGAVAVLVGCLGSGLGTIPFIAVLLVLIAVQVVYGLYVWFWQE